MKTIPRELKEELERKREAQRVHNLISSANTPKERASAPARDTILVSEDFNSRDFKKYLKLKKQYKKRSKSQR